MGRMTPPSRKSCYNFRVIEIVKVLDGDTIDVTIDLGFDLYKKERVRIAGVDTPEKRTRDLEEKELGIEATNWLKDKLDGAINGEDDLIIRTELDGGVGKYGRLLGWCYIGDSTVSLNEQMIAEGYAWEYDGGTKNKNFEELREIRRAHGTMEPEEGDGLPETFLPEEAEPDHPPLDPSRIRDNGDGNRITPTTASNLPGLY
tara:strand:- start:369 stop:974 length:606 start_codon:yes stop_codon:yes gene_type:complete